MAGHAAGQRLALDLHVHAGGGQPPEELAAVTCRHNRDGTVSAWPLVKVRLARRVGLALVYGPLVLEIAARAGVGPGTVYRHFPAKEALFETVVTASDHRCW